MVAPDLLRGGTPAGNAKSCFERSLGAIWREPAVVTVDVEAAPLERGDDARVLEERQLLRPDEPVERRRPPGPSALLAELTMP